MWLARVLATVAGRRPGLVPQTILLTDSRSNVSATAEPSSNPAGRVRDTHGTDHALEHLYETVSH